MKEEMDYCTLFSVIYCYMVFVKGFETVQGVQWLSGRVPELETEGSSLSGVTVLCPSAGHIYPTLVLFNPGRPIPI